MQKNSGLPFDDVPSKKIPSFLRVIGFFQEMERRFSSKTMAVLYMMLSNVFYTLLSLLTKLSSDIPPYQLIYHRAFFELLLSFLTVTLSHSAVFTHNAPIFRLLLLRGLMGGLGLTMYFHAIYYLPISICVVLFMLSPLWIGLGTAIKDHRFELWTFLFMAASFGGMAMIIKPGFRDESQDQEGFYVGAFLAIATSILSGVVFFSIKNLKGKVHIATIVLYFNGFNLLFSGVGQVFEGVTPLSTPKYLTLITMGVLGWSAQMLRSRALMLEKVFFVSVLMYTQIAFSYIMDIFVLKISIDCYSNVGCAVIGAAMVGLIYMEQRQK